MNNELNELVLVSVDDGYADTKIVTSTGETFKIRSNARQGSNGLTSVNGDDPEKITGSYRTGDNVFSVGEFVDGTATRFDDYPFSALNRAIVNHALRVAGLSGKNVRVATSLPFKQYYSGAGYSKNESIIQKKNVNLRTPVVALGGPPCATILEACVYSEAVSAWVDRCVDDNGFMNFEMEGPVAIVDIGGRTTDCVTMLPGWIVDHSRSGTYDIGVLDLMGEIKKGVAERFNIPENLVKDSMLEKAISHGKFRLSGTLHDINEIVARSKKDIAQRILDNVKASVGEGFDLQEILFVGGGAVVFKEIIEKYPQAVVAQNPEFANAMGMMKLMKFVS